MISKRILITMFVILFASVIGFAREYPGVGVMTAGDLWETFAPGPFAKYASESNTDATKNFSIMRLGNLERNWTTPTIMYPGGDRLNLPWGQYVFMSEYSQEEIPHARVAVDPDERTPHFVNAFWMPTLTYGTVSTNADVKGAPVWTDGGRHTMMYQAEWPTNIGVQIKMRARASTLNEANMNDFILVEMQVTNLGTADYDCDGTIDATDHDIEALSFAFSTEEIGSMYNRVNGNRQGARWLKSRLSGYDGSPDVEGNPWHIPLGWGTNVDPGAVSIDPATNVNTWLPDGQRYVGYRHGWGTMRDLWNGITFIAVKEGPMEAGPTAPDKMTIYDSHPIGEGEERGWYTTFNRTKVSFRSGYGRFLEATGTWYEDGGRSWSDVPFQAVQPDPNYFDTTQDYTAGDPLSFVNIIKPEGERGQPMGDMKYMRKWLQNWERNFPQTPAPGIPDTDTWTDGGTPQNYHNFDGDRYVGAGPFSLDVGKTMTVVWAEYAGNRLFGVRQSVKAARWAYENEWNYPKPPPMPDMKVKAHQIETGEFKTKIVWDQRAEEDPEFAGYKIYRVTAFPQVNYNEFGHRFLDNYHHQGAADVGASDDELVSKYCIPINPNWSVPADFLRLADGNPMGPWKIQAYITQAELASYAISADDPDEGTYAYEWVDTSEEVKDGYTFWYYVAAFKQGSYTFPVYDQVADVAVSQIESGKDNWNGRDGRWWGCYAFATAANEFPEFDLASQKFLGAPFVLKPARVNADELVSGEKKIGVKPNPYKVQAPHDVGNEHKVQFFNLSSDTRITIMDLSGQIMEVMEYEGQNPADGSVFWDMFTKDGPEVASGLYIWIAEYPGGQQTGYLAIQR
jgi:hypothetical protein